MPMEGVRKDRSHIFIAEYNDINFGIFILRLERINANANANAKANAQEDDFRTEMQES
jgi:hypothetical protein